MLPLGIILYNSKVLLNVTNALEWGILSIADMVVENKTIKVSW